MFCRTSNLQSWSAIARQNIHRDDWNINRAHANSQGAGEEDFAGRLCKVKGLASMVRGRAASYLKIPTSTAWKAGMTCPSPSDDGTPLEAWYIPAKGGGRQARHLQSCASHVPRWVSRPHGDPWSNFIEPVEIDFVIQYKHLTDAGYNVLTYDFRTMDKAAQPTAESAASASGNGATALA